MSSKDSPGAPSQHRVASPDPRPPGIWQVIASVSAAFFGVQSERNRQRDFQRGRPWVFVLVALLMTLGFIAMVGFAVHLALSTAGAG